MGGENSMKIVFNSWRNTRGAGLVEYGILTGLIAVMALGTVAKLGRQTEETFTSVADQLSVAAGQPSADLTGASCHDIYSQGGRESGYYTLQTDTGEMRAACYFVTSGALEGGWTVVANQLEASDLTNWDHGISNSRSDSGYFATSFAMSSAQIPPHSATAFGRQTDGRMEILDGVVMTYSTGDFEHVGANALPGLVDPLTVYDVGRNRSYGWYYNDPESGRVTGEPWWNDTLVFDAQRAGVSELTWSYSPNVGGAGRGYNYDGHLASSSESFGWVVFVR
jgi:pilus assembly protein Flp/PilA